MAEFSNWRHDSHPHPCQEQHAWPFRSGASRPRSKHMFQGLEFVSVKAQAVLHLWPRRSWHVLMFFRRARQRVSSRFVHNFYPGTHSCGAMYFPIHAWISRGSIFSSGDPTPRGEQGVQDFESVCIHVHTGVLQLSSRRSWHFLEMFLLSTHQRFDPKSTSEFLHTCIRRQVTEHCR